MHHTSVNGKVKFAFKEKLKGFKKLMVLNLFSASQLSTTNFSLYNTYKI